MPHADTLAAASGQFWIGGGEFEVNRLGFGAMRVTGRGIWGPPADKSEAIRVLPGCCAARRWCCRSPARER